MMLVYPLGAILPDPDDYEANQADERWRIIFLGPAFVAIVVILLVLVPFNLEPIAYSITCGKEEAGMKHMRRVYRKKDESSPESIEEILEM